MSKLRYIMRRHGRGESVEMPNTSSFVDCRCSVKRLDRAVMVRGECGVGLYDSMDARPCFGSCHQSATRLKRFELDSALQDGSDVCIFPHHIHPLPSVSMNAPCCEVAQTQQSRRSPPLEDSVLLAPIAILCDDA